MKNYTNLFALVVITTLALEPGVTFAHRLTGPASVLAGAEGHFAYNVVLVVEPAVPFYYSLADGSDNTDVGWTADGFCLEDIPAGTYQIEIEGNLIDTRRPGTVIYSHHMCDGWSGEVTTRILPNPLSAVEEEVFAQRTWGAVKSLYR